jgi:hypothetical protein
MNKKCARRATEAAQANFEAGHEAGIADGRLAAAEGVYRVLTVAALMSGQGLDRYAHALMNELRRELEEIILPANSLDNMPCAGSA